MLEPIFIKIYCLRIETLTIVPDIFDHDHMLRKMNHHFSKHMEAVLLAYIQVS